MKNTYSFSDLINLVRQKVSVTIKMILFELAFSNDFVGNFSFQIHEASQHIIIGLAAEQNPPSVH